MALDGLLEAHEARSKRRLNAAIMTVVFLLISVDFDAKVRIFPLTVYFWTCFLRYFAMMKKRILHLLILIALLTGLHGCQKYPENPNRPSMPFSFSIYPNTLQYQEINCISGWIYVTSEVESTSRGIIVYRLSQNEFLAYDRLPPNEPNACTDDQGNTTRLVVDFPFVVDRCNNAYYNILNGQIIVAEPDMIPNFPTEGVPVYPLIQYHTQYDGNKLTIYN